MSSSRIVQRRSKHLTLYRRALDRLVFDAVDIFKVSSSTSSSFVFPELCTLSLTTSDFELQERSRKPINNILAALLASAKSISNLKVLKLCAPIIDDTLSMLVGPDADENEMHFPNSLTELDIASCYTLTEKCVMESIARMKNLRFLNAASIPKIISKGSEKSKELRKARPNLQICFGTEYEPL